eukprot:g7927.t1
MSGSATDLGQESGPMQHAIEKQAKHLGMDLETDREFLWLAKESLNAELPAGWISRTFGKDQHYYVNRKTGDTIWEHPADKIYKERFLDLKKKSEEEKSRKSKEERLAKEKERKKQDLEKKVMLAKKKEAETAKLQKEAETARLQKVAETARLQKVAETARLQKEAETARLLKEAGEAEAARSIAANEPRPNGDAKPSGAPQQGSRPGAGSASTPSGEGEAASTPASQAEPGALLLLVKRQTQLLKQKSMEATFYQWRANSATNDDTEIIALERMKERAFLEEELEARDLLIEQLTIKLTSQEDATMAIVEDYAKLQDTVEQLKHRSAHSARVERGNAGMASPASSRGMNDSMAQVDSTFISTVPSTPGMVGVMGVTQGAANSIFRDTASGELAPQANPESSVLYGDDADNRNNDTLIQGVNLSFPSPDDLGAGPATPDIEGADNTDIVDPAPVDLQKMERLFSIYATKQHIRKSDRKRGGLVFALEKSEDHIMETPKTLSSLRFMRMLRDSKAMDTKLTAAQVDIVFRRATSKNLRKNSFGDNQGSVEESTPTRKRLRFTEFLNCVKELARKKYNRSQNLDDNSLAVQRQEAIWMSQLWHGFLFPLLQRHEEGGRTTVVYPPRTPTPINPMTPIETLELSSHPHQAILDTVDRELASVEGTYGEAEKVSKIEDLDNDIWDDTDEDEGPMGLLVKYQDSLRQIFESHASRDIQHRSIVPDSKLQYFMGRQEFFKFAAKYRILGHLLSRVALENVFQTSVDGAKELREHLSFKSFLFALILCGTMAYRGQLQVEDDNSSEIDAIYRIMFRIDPGGKRFKSLRKRYHSFQEKHRAMALKLERQEMIERLQEESPNLSPRGLPGALKQSNGRAERRSRGNSESTRGQPDAERPNGGEQALGDTVAPTAGSDVAGPDREMEDFQLIESAGTSGQDVIEMVCEVYDHFATKPQDGEAHGILTLQKFMRALRAARLVDHTSKNVRLPIDVATLNMVYSRVNLQLRTEPHRMTFESFSVSLCRIARFKYVYVPEQWVEENETNLYDDNSRTHAKDTEALKRLIIDHFIPLANHLREQMHNPKLGKTLVKASELSLNFEELDRLVQKASTVAQSMVNY